MTSDSNHQILFDDLKHHLTGNDDPALWQQVIETVFADAEYLCDRQQAKQDIFAHIGCCSHWMSPHNKGSWFKDQGFAWPTGYSSDGFTVFGLPEFDWHETWKRGENENLPWQKTEQVQGKRPLVFRVAIPARSMQHARSVIHTLWTPGSPTRPNEKLLQAYAFEKQEESWTSSATFGEDAVYE